MTAQENLMLLPTSADLAAYMGEATQNCTQDQFISNYLNAVYGILLDDPRQYRAYGVFWWAIKLAFNERGIFEFGYEVDASAIAQLERLTLAECLCAAYANKQHAVNMGRLYCADHEYDGTDGTPYFYALDDAEMEQMIVGNKKTI